MKDRFGFAVCAPEAILQMQVCHALVMFADELHRVTAKCGEMAGIERHLDMGECPSAATRFFSYAMPSGFRSKDAFSECAATHTL
jgi:hypothetical protein